MPVCKRRTGDIGSGNLQKGKAPATQKTEFGRFQTRTKYFEEETIVRKGYYSS